MQMIFASSLGLVPNQVLLQLGLTIIDRLQKAMLLSEMP